MSDGPTQAGDKQPGDARGDDSTHPGMSADPEERGRQLGHENAHGGQSIGTGGHGNGSGAGSSQPVGGKHVIDQSQFSEQELHPGMNPDPTERGRQLGHENAHGGHCVGTGGHCVGKDGHSVGIGGQCVGTGGHCVGTDGHCVGTGGHGNGSGADSSQPVGGKHVIDQSQFSEQELHPGMNPDPTERGRQLGHENAHGGHSVGTGGHCVGKDGHSVGTGGHSVGTGGHGASGANSDK